MSMLLIPIPDPIGADLAIGDPMIATMTAGPIGIIPLATTIDGSIAIVSRSIRWDDTVDNTLEMLFFVLILI